MRRHSECLSGKKTGPVHSRQVRWVAVQSEDSCFNLEILVRFEEYQRFKEMLEITFIDEGVRRETVGERAR